MFKNYVNLKEYLDNRNARIANNISRKDLNNSELLLSSFYYWSISHLYRTPGLSIHRKIALLYLKLLLNKKIDSDTAYNNILYPLDTTRYSEFDFMWNALRNTKFLKYLDVSSPRLLFILLMLRSFESHTHIVNPDKHDLEATKFMIDLLKLQDRVTYYNTTTGNLDFRDEHFDAITSMSVIEHMPDNDDTKAVKNMWSWLRKEGILLISVPCARNGFEEHVNAFDYGLLEKDKNGYVFGQRFYDEDTLKNKFFSVIGPPEKYTIYGEIKEGSLYNIRKEKIQDIHYPVWKEPYIIGKTCRYYRSISELPGWGVISMLFHKR